MRIFDVTPEKVEHYQRELENNIREFGDGELFSNEGYHLFATLQMLTQIHKHIDAKPDWDTLKEKLDAVGATEDTLHEIQRHFYRPFGMLYSQIEDMDADQPNFSKGLRISRWIEDALQQGLGLPNKEEITQIMKNANIPCHAIDIVLSVQYNDRSYAQKNDCMEVG